MSRLSNLSGAPSLSAPRNGQSSGSGLSGGLIPLSVPKPKPNPGGMADLDALLDIIDDDAPKTKTSSAKSKSSFSSKAKSKSSKDKKSSKGRKSSSDKTKSSAGTNKSDEVLAGMHFPQVVTIAKSTVCERLVLLCMNLVACVVLCDRR